MEHLSQSSQDLLNNRNPAAILDQEQFQPLYAPPLTGRWINGDSSTEELSSSPIRPTTGMKRTRSVSRPEIEIEPHFKQLKIDSVWHKPYVTEIMTHPVWGTKFPTQTVNNNFFPRYLAYRMPLPEHLLSTIFNKYLNAFDRQIITGDHFLLTKVHEIIQHRNDLSFAGVSKAGHNTWYLSTYSIVDEDPNSPHPEQP